MEHISTSLHIRPEDQCAVIVAHPDDEALWVGGVIIAHPDADWTIVSLCRESDPDRAPKFLKACRFYGAGGFIGDMDDGPEQKPLADAEVQDTIMHLLPRRQFDFIFSHGQLGEYTRHRRHEEVSGAVSILYREQRLRSRRLVLFAYEDGGGKYLPKPDSGADIFVQLTPPVWEKKMWVISTIYGFSPESWEAKTTPRQEAFVIQDNVRPTD